MKRERWQALGIGALAGALACSCALSTKKGDPGQASSSPPPQNGAGSNRGDAGAAGGHGATDGAATACVPADVSTFTPPPYKSADGLPGSCTAAQIDAFYHDCLAPTSTTTTCDPFLGGTASSANKACAECIISPATASSYGALVERDGRVDVNVAGCIELTGGANGLTCAMSYQTYLSCGETACNSAACPVTDEASLERYHACVGRASTGGCGKYAISAACAGTEADGGATSVCFAGESFADFYRNVVPVFCK